MDRRRLLGAFIIGAALATAIVVAQWASDPQHKTSYGDGLIYRYVAAHFTTLPSQIDPIVVERGTSLRYGRVGLPAMIWIASGGRPSLMQYAHPALMVLAAGAASAAAAALLPGAGPPAAALPFLAPGFPLSIAGGFGDGVALALCLWGGFLALKARWWPAGLVLGYAVLTRENAVFVVAGIALWSLLNRGVRPLVPLLVGLVPVTIWYAFVASRFGHVPVLDPYLRTATSSIPVVALIKSFTAAYSSSSVAALLIHLVMAGVLVALFRSSFFALVGAVVTTQILVSGPYVWRFIGEAFRVSVLIQIFLLLALIAWRRPVVAEPKAVPAVART